MFAAIIMAKTKKAAEAAPAAAAEAAGEWINLSQIVVY